MLPNTMIKFWTKHSTTFHLIAHFFVFLSFLLKKKLQRNGKFPEIQKENYIHYCYHYHIHLDALNSNSVKHTKLIKTSESSIIENTKYTLIKTSESSIIENTKYKITENHWKSKHNVRAKLRESLKIKNTMLGQTW